MEDPRGLEKILGSDYHVMVGNPPYIVIRDKSSDQAYQIIIIKLAKRQVLKLMFRLQTFLVYWLCCWDSSRPALAVR